MQNNPPFDLASLLNHKMGAFHMKPNWGHAELVLISAFDLWDSFIRSQTGDVGIVTLSSYDKVLLLSLRLLLQFSDSLFARFGYSLPLCLISFFPDYMSCQEIARDGD